MSFEERKAFIDASLTVPVVISIFGEHIEKIKKESQSGKQHISIVYPSTAALMRRINGQSEKIIGISACDLKDSSDLLKVSQAARDCLGTTKTCICVCTFLPLGTSGSAITHSVTAIQLK